MGQRIRGTSRYRYLYLIRHGDYEQMEGVDGGVLTEKGREQSRLVAEHLARLPIDAIHSSTMNRAHETAKIISDHGFPDLKIKRTPILRERLFPGLLELEEGEEDCPEAVTILEKIWSRYFRPSRSERHEIVVCHGNVIRALTTRVVGAPLNNWYKSAIHNCSITEVCIRGHSRNHLMSFNERVHLPFALR